MNAGHGYARLPGRLASATCLALMLLTGCTARADEAPTPKVRALLIGEWDYGDAGLPDLDGPRNDIELMRSLLTQRFGVPERDVVTLANPTHGQVQQAFADMARQVQSGDIVYIHYSGHGSTAPDPGEPRGQDQTWVPHGARVKGASKFDSMDILDKEIALWLQPIYDLTPDVVFVSDSCHSATVARGAPRKGVRQVETLGVPHPLLATIKRVPAPTTGLRIGAARDFESAVELEPTDGHNCAKGSPTCYGVFTWNWAQALRESAPGTSWGDVFRRATARVSAVPGTLQRPQLEGHADRAVLQDRFAPLARTVEVSEVGPGGAVLTAGWLAGVTAGSRYEVTTPAAAASGASAAVLRVDSVDGATSRATIVSGQVRAGDLAAETVHAAAAARIRLFVGADARDAAGSRKLAGAVQAASNRLAAYEPVTDKRATELAIVPVTVQRSGCKPACKATTQWQVQTAQGQLADPMLRFDLGRATSELPRMVDDLEAFAWARQLRALGERGNPTTLSLAIKSAMPLRGSSGQCEDSLAAAGHWKLTPADALDRVSTTRPVGECLSFEIANRDPYRSMYGYVVAIGPDFHVQAVWPSPGDGADAARVAPADKVVSTTFYHLGQPGRESLLFLSSDQAIDAALLQHAGVRGGPPASPLESALAAAANRRGDVQTIGQWGAVAIDLQVVAPQGARQ